MPILKAIGAAEGSGLARETNSLHRLTCKLNMSLVLPAIIYILSLCKEIEFKNYLQGVGDPGTRLLFKFRSGTNGLNEELGRHRGKNDDRQCKLCRGECESVVHVLWECPAYDSIRNNFMVELENLLGGEVWGV